ncbi:MAG: hypothetical protein QW703_01665 [Candidatus Aenigmatarchaeota archaeon]
MAQLRGAVEMSIGFIVVIVIAVVMLVLVLNWLRGMFTGVTDLTGTLQQEAINNLREAFQTRSGNFFIYPIRYEVSPNTKLPVVAGIFNDAADGKTHSYVIGVSVEEVPTGVSKSDVLGWVTWAKSPKNIPINKDDNIAITITIPSAAVKGTYIFRITPCSDINTQTNTITSVPSAESCTPTHTNIWSSAKDFVLIVK